MEVKLNDTQSLLLSMKKPLISLFIIAILLLILYQIYIRIISPKIKQSNYILVSHKNTNEQLIIPSFEIPAKSESESESDTKISVPYDQYSYTLILQIRVNEYYDNLEYWKHILHKGTKTDSENVWKYRDWSEIETQLPQQGPGLWFHPAQNTMRFCLNTTRNYDYDEIPVHANDVSSVMRRDKERSLLKNEYNTPQELLEYIDIPNVPINRDVEYTIIVDRTNITILQDNKNIIFKQLKGLPKINTSPIEIHHKTTYKGEILNLSFVPYPLTQKTF